MIEKIKINIVVEGEPIIELWGKRLDTTNKHLHVIKDGIIGATKRSAFNNIRSIVGWGGKMAHRMIGNPAQSIFDAVVFDDIMLVTHISGNIQDQSIIDEIYPCMAQLVFTQRPRFGKIADKDIFECFICGEKHFMPYSNHQLSKAPVFCKSHACYSHKIWKMLDPEYECGKEPEKKDAFKKARGS